MLTTHHPLPPLRANSEHPQRTAPPQNRRSRSSNNNHYHHNYHNENNAPQKPMEDDNDGRVSNMTINVAAGRMVLRRSPPPSGTTPISFRGSGSSMSRSGAASSTASTTKVGNTMMRLWKYYVLAGLFVGVVLHQFAGLLLAVDNDVAMIERLYHHDRPSSSHQQSSLSSSGTLRMTRQVAAGGKGGDPPEEAAAAIGVVVPPLPPKGTPLSSAQLRQQLQEQIQQRAYAQRAHHGGDLASRGMMIINVNETNQQSIHVAQQALRYRLPTSTVPRRGDDDATNRTIFTLTLPLTNASVPPWQQTIMYKRAAAERLARGGDVASPIPIAPLHIYNLHQEQLRQQSGDGANDHNTTSVIPPEPSDSNRTLPILAIITATRSHHETNVSQADLQKRLIYSIGETITDIERTHWRIQLWIGIDDTDHWWVQHWPQLIAPDWLEVYLCIIPDQIHRVPFTEVAYAAYTSISPPDYLVRVNDDTGFLTSRWITLAAAHLQNSYDPPNVGVVGPECAAGNTMILTHDFVHATHMEIFRGYYYPTVFRNWYLDDWISVRIHYCTPGRFLVACLLFGLDPRFARFLTNQPPLLLHKTTKTDRVQQQGVGAKVSSQNYHVQGLEGQALDLGLELRAPRGRRAVAADRIRVGTAANSRPRDENCQQQ
jgi:hypothetical protein